MDLVYLYSETREDYCKISGETASEKNRRQESPPHPPHGKDKEGPEEFVSKKEKITKREIKEQDPRIWGYIFLGALILKIDQSLLIILTQ